MQQKMLSDQPLAAKEKAKSRAKKKAIPLQIQTHSKAGVAYQDENIGAAFFWCLLAALCVGLPQYLCYAIFMRSFFYHTAGRLCH